MSMSFQIFAKAFMQFATGQPVLSQSTQPEYTAFK